MLLVYAGRRHAGALFYEVTDDHRSSHELLFPYVASLYKGFVVGHVYDIPGEEGAVATIRPRAARFVSRWDTDEVLTWQAEHQAVLLSVQKAKATEPDVLRQLRQLYLKCGSPSARAAFVLRVLTSLQRP